jgi:S-adenosylmethionine synthetase
MRATGGRRVLGAIAAVVAGLAVAWFALPGPIGVDLATAVKGPMEVTVDDDGKTRVRHIYTVSAPIPGKVLRISQPDGKHGMSLHVGDQVKADETVVAVMQPTIPGFIDVRSREELQAAVAAADAAINLAEAEIKRIQAALAFSCDDLQRAQTLSRSGTISAKALEKAQLDVTTNEAALASAQAQLGVRRSEARASRLPQGFGPRHRGAARACDHRFRRAAGGLVTAGARLPRDRACHHPSPTLLDVDRDVRFDVLIEPGSQDLRHLFARRHRLHLALANDTSIGVGHAPLSPLERLVLNAERAINGRDRERDHPAWGEDAKVMALRSGDMVHVTVACAMIGRYLPHMDDYLAEKAAIEKAVLEVAMGEGFSACEVSVNAADDTSTGSIYLTVTGTSAEAGDDGQVGRGNRVNGLITPCRRMSLEATAGKNPVTHVGKIYNVLANDLSQALVNIENVGGERIVVQFVGGVTDNGAQFVLTHSGDAFPTTLEPGDVRQVIFNGGDLAPLKDMRPIHRLFARTTGGKVWYAAKEDADEALRELVSQLKGEAAG